MLAYYTNKTNGCLLLLDIHENNYYLMVLSKSCHQLLWLVKYSIFATNPSFCYLQLVPTGFLNHQQQ